MTLLLSSIAPALLIMFLIYRYDLEKEPLKMLVLAFFGGVVSIFVSLLFSQPLSVFINVMPSGFFAEFYRAFFIAAIPEELAKWLVFWMIIQRAKDFDQYYDGILYAIFISMGFALVENILYVMKGGMSVAILRAILAVPGHMLFAVPMGYYLSRSKFEQGATAFQHRAYRFTWDIRFYTHVRGGERQIFPFARLAIVNCFCNIRHLYVAPRFKKT